ncbi:MAG: ribosomal RNA small subunit methyltransferase A [SAR324 cluster bacterium]|uniref:Ribosomal RNA small subunit methyltransferase A n=1 Tax=SAR324 cluster bacterium TaxID=2024889 RepID=A0A2A4TA48_9DELT|nr:MAG: ribosomal RNA small subunit methyltransferase A [SAR324 cluster bacterium]
MNNKRPFARKRFGQHFLIDSSINAQIISSGSLTPEDHVIEIGPGRGAITEPLLRSGASLTVVEIDRDLAEYLREKFGDYPNFKLIEADILQVDWMDLIQQGKRNKVIANLPYNISSPIFFEFVKYRRFFHSITIMVQRELALRVCHSGREKPFKDYGILSVVAGNTFETDWICDVAGTCFNPPPKVESAVIRLRPRTHEIQDEKEFFKFVRQAFNQRRKIFLSQLKKWDPEFYEKLPSDTLEALKNKRPENIMPQQYVDLFQNFRFEAEGE